jgi:hypothetical protein
MGLMPSIMGLLLVAVPELFRADFMEPENLSSLPESTWLMAYMTVKKAKSNVMKSAYDTTHRSGLSYSAGRFFFLIAAFPLIRATVGLAVARGRLIFSHRVLAESFFCFRIRLSARFKTSLQKP